MKFLRIPTAAVVIALAAFTPAWAQETVLTNDASTAPTPPPAAWATQCISDGRQSAADCSIVQRAVMQNTGQLVGSITIRVPSSGKSTVIANIPLGLFIPAGVTVDVDGTLPQKLELQTCDRNGCYASGALPANVIAAMGKGKKLNVVFQSLSKQPVTLPMSLAGFQGAYDKTKMTNG